MHSIALILRTLPRGHMCGLHYRKSDKQKIAEAFHATKVDDFILPPRDCNFLDPRNYAPGAGLIHATACCLESNSAVEANELANPGIDFISMMPAILVLDDEREVHAVVVMTMNTYRGSRRKTQRVRCHGVGKRGFS